MAEGAATTSGAPEAAWPARLGLGLALAATLALLQLVATASVEVPYLDDYDAVLAFSNRFRDETSPSVRLRLLFAAHNEHRIAVPRALVLLAGGARGSVDLRALDLLGVGFLLLLIGALFAASRGAGSVRRNGLAFAVVPLLLLHPQYWSALLWPTTSLSNFGVVAFAALAFAALARPSRAGSVVAAAAAAAAVFSQGNGILVPLLAPLVPWLRGERQRAAAFALFAAVLVGLLLAFPDAAGAGTDLRRNLPRLDRVALYALDLAGCAAAFSQPGLSTAAGLALAASAVALTGFGLPRRNPALFALLLFLFASLVANALLRAHQGPGSALAQPRYRFYASAVLALCWLGWWELRIRDAGLRVRRRIELAAAALAAAFTLGSHAAYAGEVRALAQRLEEGVERWWTVGDGGLFHPDFRKASFYLLQSYDRGLLRPPAALVARQAVRPEPHAASEPDPALRAELQALHAWDSLLLVAGWAHAGESATGQEVEVVLDSGAGAWSAPAFAVLRADLDPNQRARLARFGASGFRALLHTDALPPGDYRVGVRVRRGAREHVRYLGRVALGKPSS